MRGDLHRYITPDYFGYRDDDDGVLATREAVVEAEKIAEAVKKFRDTEKSTGAISVDMNVTSAMERRLHEEDEEDFRLFLEHHLSSSTTAADGNNTAVAVEALSQGPEKKQVELESALLEERKSSLLSMLL